MTRRCVSSAIFASCRPAVLLIACVASAGAHEPVLLDPNRATPGVRVQLVPASADSNPDLALGYRVVARGFPPGITFSVWTKHFGHAFHEAASGFHVDAAGKLVSTEPDAFNRPQYLDDMLFQPEAYPRGANWQVAVASSDLTIAGFATVIPRPITASDGPCVVSLELVSHRGERFLASAIGFTPGDDVIVESRYSGRVSRKQRTASDAGVLPPDVIWHASPGDDRSARYSVKGRYCEVALDYEWGKPALLGQK